ncbi:MAG: HD domain-containing protein [Smithellaceae bacterium]|nr:HD domain-containing protein [Smithellaceae bacterium]
MGARSSLDTAKSLVARLIEAGHEAYLVGGCVRDLLRQVEPEDYDIATSARPEEVQKLFPRTAPIGASFGVILVLEDGRGYEVATFRSDLAYQDGRRPSEVRYATAREDVLRRDFTINGLLLDPTTGEITDYSGGRSDLEKGIIRAIGRPRERFAEDHLRMLRAVRFAAAFGFEMDPDTFSAIKDQAEKILLISAERIRIEMTKLLTQGGARRGMELLEASGLLRHILPEVSAMSGVLQDPAYHPEGDVREHTLRMLALLPSDPLAWGADERLAWGALLHDVGKPPACFRDEKGIHFYGHEEKGEELARDLMRRLRFSIEVMDSVLALIRHHVYFQKIKQVRPAKLKRFLRLPDFSRHLELHRLDCLASHGRLDSYHFCRDKLALLSREELHPPPLLNGRDLLEMGFSPGPKFKKMLDALEDAQLEKQLADRGEARRFIRERFGKPSG